MNSHGSWPSLEPLIRAPIICLAFWLDSKKEEIKKVLLFEIQVIHCHIADNAPKLEEAAESAGREDVVNWKGQRLKLLPPSQLD